MNFNWRLIKRKNEILYLKKDDFIHRLNNGHSFLITFLTGAVVAAGATGAAGAAALLTFLIPFLTGAALLAEADLVVLDADL